MSSTIGALPCIMTLQHSNLLQRSNAHLANVPYAFILSGNVKLHQIDSVLQSCSCKNEERCKQIDCNAEQSADLRKIIGTMRYAQMPVGFLSFIFMHRCRTPAFTLMPLY